MSMGYEQVDGQIEPSGANPVLAVGRSLLLWLDGRGHEASGWKPGCRILAELGKPRPDRRLLAQLIGELAAAAGKPDCDHVP